MPYFLSLRSVAFLSMRLAVFPRRKIRKEALKRKDEEQKGAEQRQLASQKRKLAEDYLAEAQKLMAEAPANGSSVMLYLSRKYELVFGLRILLKLFFLFLINSSNAS